MHAVALAEELRMPKVIIPMNSSVFSAWGMLMSDLRRDYLRTQVVELSAGAAGTVANLFADMAEQARERFAADPLAGKLPVRLKRFADLRYAGQEHTVKVELPDGPLDAAGVQRLSDSFHETHHREYTFRLDNPVEIVNFHLVAYGEVARHEPQKLASSGRAVGAAVTGKRRVDYDEHGVHEAVIYDRDQLEPGMHFNGPCIVEESAATLVVPPGKRVEVDAYGNLHVQIS
jgi:N-methylhydantoinase A